jgi:hypothetical protein
MLNPRAIRALAAALLGVLTGLPQPGQAAVRVLRSDAQGVALEFVFGSPELAESGLTDADGGVRVQLADCIRYEVPGEPDLPQLRVLCGIAQEGGVELSTSWAEVEELDGIDIAPAARYVDGRAQVVRGSVYGEPGFYPRAPVVVEDVAMLRDVRVARLLLSPVQYDPVLRRLRILHRITATLAFARPARKASEVPLTPGFEGLYPEMLVNGSSAAAWKTARETRATGAGFPGNGSFFDRSPNWLKIVTESTGVYCVGYDDLVRCGANPRLIDPRTFQVFGLGEHVPNSQFPDSLCELPVLVPGEEDSSFDRGDCIIFYGRAAAEWDPQLELFRTNLYTRYNAFWLTWGVSDGRRMAQGLGIPLAGEPVRNSALGREHREIDALCPARSGLLWVWRMMSKTPVTPELSADFDLDLDRPVAITRLTGRLYDTTRSNAMNVYLNGVLLDSLSFGSHPWASPYDFRLDYTSRPCPGLDSLQSRLTLELEGDSFMQVYPDWFEVDYVKRLCLNRTGQLRFFVDESTPQTFTVRGLRAEPLVLSLDDPYRPRRITGGRQAGDSVVFRVDVSDTAQFLVTDLDHLLKPRAVTRRHPGQLRAPGFAADYVIIAPDQLCEPAAALARYRTNNVPGFRTAVVRALRLEDVYDDFGFGRAEPVAIKQCLSGLRPTYGMLLGDATYDYRDMLGLHPLPGVPPCEEGYDLMESSYGYLAVARDAWFADFDGDGSTPDMFLGRVTVRTPEECRGFVSKLISYEQGRPGAWCRRGILLADDEWLGWPGRYYEDRIGLSHVLYCETMASLFGDRLDPVKVYLTEYPTQSYGDKPTGRRRLLSELQRGALLFCFFGHGAGDNLTHENVLPLKYVGQTANDGRAPFCFFGSCGVGRWEDSKTECIAEEMTRKPDGGAIATVGASKATASESNFQFAQRLFSALLSNPDSGLGRAYVAALPIINIYHLFGDPALRIPLPEPGGTVRVEPESLQPGQAAVFGGSVPIEQGYAATTLTGPMWLRTYNSANILINPRNVTYVLPGDDFYRGTCRVAQHLFRGDCFIPTGMRRGLRTVPDGSYVELGRTLKLSVVAWEDGRLIGLSRSDVALDTILAAGTDSSGPEITLQVEGRKLTPGETCLVSSSFNLDGRLSDASGLLLCPVIAGEPFYVYVSDYRNRVSLQDRFRYDAQSGTSGSFSYPVTLETDLDSIVVVASDNRQNRSMVKVLARVLGDDRPQVFEPLVYPNPLPGAGAFTFQVSVPARVRVRVYTLSGRPVRELDLAQAQPGFNSLSWDGTDRAGNPLPNGVYIYGITALRERPGQGTQASPTLRDRFIIRR